MRRADRLFEIIQRLRRGRVVTVRALRIDGAECALRPGDTLIIPPGVPHAVWNAYPAGCRAIGEFRPALDSQATLEAFFAA